MYNKLVLEHFQQPRNLEAMKSPDAKGMGASPICGDVMTLYLKITAGKIERATFTTMGCGAAIASGSILTEMLPGMSLEDAAQMTTEKLVKALGGLPAIKMHCPDLALEALNSALKTISPSKKASASAPQTH